MPFRYSCRSNTHAVRRHAMRLLKMNETVRKYTKTAKDFFLRFFMSYCNAFFLEFHSETKGTQLQIAKIECNDHCYILPHFLCHHYIKNEY